jgi:hypothetical protein
MEAFGNSLVARLNREKATRPPLAASFKKNSA